MTPRTLFVIICKVLGIFMLKEVIFSGVGIISNLLVIAGNNYNSYGYTLLISSVLSLVVYFAFFYVLVFRPQAVINKLELDQGFYEEQFSLVSDPFMIMRIALIVAGLFLLVNSVPTLCKETVAYYQAFNSSIYSETKNYNGQNIAYSGAKIIAAYVMLTNSSVIANFITNRHKEPSGD